MNRLRKIYDSIAGPVNRFIDRPAPSDPFYLTNRTWGQKLRMGVVVAVPCLLLAGAVALGVSGYFEKRIDPTAPQPGLTPEQVAAKMLPNLDKDLKIETNRDIEVADVHIVQGGATKVAGTVRNTTAHVIRDAELFFDLTDASGSRLGAVATKIPSIAPQSAMPFSFPVEQRTAAFALVREIRQ